MRCDESIQQRGILHQTDQSTRDSRGHAHKAELLHATRTMPDIKYHFLGGSSKQILEHH
jgi:hypothetical protein